jgi:hypothetical protein
VNLALAIVWVAALARNFTVPIVCSSISPGEDVACQANLDDVCVDSTIRLLATGIIVWEANKSQLLLGSKPL